MTLKTHLKKPCIDVILLPAWSRRWVNAPDYPFPAGDFSIGGYTSHPVGVNSPFYNKCRNKMSTYTELISLYHSILRISISPLLFSKYLSPNINANKH